MIEGIDITFIVGISVGIFVVFLIIVGVVNFLKRGNAYTEMDKLIKSGHFKKALTIGKNYIAQNPTDFLVKYYIAQCYEGLKDMSLAIDYYEKASISQALAEEEIIKTKIYMKLAELYRKMERPKDALAYYIMVLDREPKNPSALYDVSGILFAMGNYPKARQYLESLVKFKTNHFKARFLLSKIYIKLGLNADAANQLKATLEVLPPSMAEMKTQVAILLSDVYLSSKNYSEAIKILTPLLDEEGFFEDVLVKMMDSYIRINQAEKAIDLGNKNLSRLPKEGQAKVYYLIGNAYFKMRETYKAVMNWNMAYKCNPSYKDLKDIVNRYAAIIKSPKFENFYTTNESVFHNFALKMLGGAFPKQILKRENFWAYELGDNPAIIFKNPYAVSKQDLEEMESLVNHQFRSNMPFKLYSLYGVSPEISTAVAKSSRLSLVANEEFVRLVNEA